MVRLESLPPRTSIAILIATNALVQLFSSVVLVVCIDFLISSCVFISLSALQEPLAFKRELVLLTLLSNDSPWSRVLRFFGAYQERAKYYLVTELAAGGDLLNYLSKHETSDAQRLALALQCALALQQLHELGVVHRDIKLQNFLCFPSPPNVGLVSTANPKIPVDPRLLEALSRGEEGLTLSNTRHADEGITFQIDKASLVLFNNRTSARHQVVPSDHVQVKIADLGLARTATDQRTASKTYVGGTFCYLDPQLLSSSVIRHELHPHHDIYSMGFLLWEIWHSKSLASIPAFVDHPPQEYASLDWDEGAPSWLALLSEQCRLSDAARRPTIHQIANQLADGLAVFWLEN